jgi:alkylation response protein AidB-like acyl-CoA dehydrogenase
LGQNAAAAILRWGTEAQRERFLLPISHQKEYWVQLFSEPGAGSDLAGLATRAVRDGDQWIVNGQKVWSSYGHIADYGLLVARTDPDVPKHQGLTVFLLNMRQPGVTVRPLRHITGEAHFNEVFFDNAVIPDTERLGELGQGWSMVSSLLAFERGGGGGGATSGDVGRNVVGLQKHYGHIADPQMRQRLAEAYCRERIGGWIRMRIDANRKAGLPPGHEKSIQKLFHSEHMQDLQNLSIDLEGLRGIAREPGDKWAESAVYAFLFSRSLTIAGGTSEIQRNIIGEKVLGLPREPAVDRDIPWRETRRS